MLYTYDALSHHLYYSVKQREHVFGKDWISVIGLEPLGAYSVANINLVCITGLNLLRVYSVENIIDWSTVQLRI